MFKVRFGVDFGVSFRVVFVKNVILLEKRGARKQLEKKYPQKQNNTELPCPRAPGQPPLASKSFLNKNNNDAKKDNNIAKMVASVRSKKLKWIIHGKSDI